MINYMNIVLLNKEYKKLFDILHYLLLKNHLHKSINCIYVYTTESDELNWIIKYFDLCKGDINIIYNYDEFNENNHLSDIIFDESLIPNKKVLFTTCCTDNYVPGLKVLLKSCLKNIDNFDYDFKVFYNKDCQPLNDAHKQELLEIYSKLDFIGINDKDFKITRKPKPIRLTKNCFLSHYFFKDYGYDYNVFLDSDMIVNRDFTFLFKYAHDFIGSYDIDEPGNKPNIWNIYNFNCNKRINSGFMIIDKSYMGDDIFDKIIELTNNRKLKIHGDQCSTNYLIQNMKRRTVIPYYFNNQVRVCNKLKAEESYVAKYSYIYHYVGAIKPWMKDDNFSILEKEWLKYK
jgi:hypothetical protein